MSFAIHDSEPEPDLMTALSDLLNQHLPEGWTASDVERAAQNRGYQITRQTVWGMLRGKHSAKPDEETLNALADVLNIPVKRLRAAVGLPEGENQPWAPPVEASRLNRRQRAALEDFIRATVDAIEVMPEQAPVLRAALQPARHPSRRRATSPK